MATIVGNDTTLQSEWFWCGWERTVAFLGDNKSRSQFEPENINEIQQRPFMGIDIPRKIDTDLW